MHTKILFSKIGPAMLTGWKMLSIFLKKQKEADRTPDINHGEYSWNLESKIYWILIGCLYALAGGFIVGAITSGYVYK